MLGLDCVITMNSIQKMGEDKDCSSEVYKGQYYNRLEKRYISYKRATAEGEISVLLNFSEDYFSITQQGVVNSKMEFKTGERTCNSYSTSVGALTIDVITREYEVEQMNDYIKINLKYDIMSGANVAVENSMNINVKL